MPTLPLQMAISTPKMASWGLILTAGAFRSPQEALGVLLLPSLSEACGHQTAAHGNGLNAGGAVYARLIGMPRCRAERREILLDRPKPPTILPP